MQNWRLKSHRDAGDRSSVALRRHDVHLRGQSPSTLVDDQRAGSSDVTSVARLIFRMCSRKSPMSAATTAAALSFR